MENKTVLDILRRCDSLLEGHFLLSSGKHSDRYCQCAKLMQYPDRAAEVLFPLAEKLKPLGASVIIGPAMGGIVVAYELARLLGIKGIFTERVEGEMTLRRGFDLAKGEKVIVAEDVVTTGKSTLETLKALEKYEVEVVGLCCIVDRRPPDIQLSHSLYSATTLTVKTYDEGDCPLCKAGLPIEKPGSRVFKTN